MTDAPTQGLIPAPSAHGRLRTPAGLRRVLQAFGDRSGGAAVEFAIVSAMLICTILFIMFGGLVLYLTQALDYATSKASRQIMIGYVQKNGISQSDFQTKILCSYLPKSINCSNVIVNVQTLASPPQSSGYYQFVNSSQTALITPNLSNTGAQFNPGIQASYVYVQVIYPITFLPQFMASILGTATYNGSPAFLATSTAAFKNEQY